MTLQALEEREIPPVRSRTQQSGSHALIVVGASAGGVGGLQRLVAGLPADIPAAVLISLHVSPSHPSLLPLILDRAGPLPTSMAMDGEPIEPGHIYVAPPNRHLLVGRGRLRLWLGPPEHGFRPAVNPMFRTAARTHRASVIGVLLSGALYDGAAGLMAIKVQGGTAVLQDPSETRYPQMSLNAMKNVDIDHIVALDDLAPLLSRLAQAAAVRRTRARAVRPSAEPTERARERAQLESDAAGTSTNFTCPTCGGGMWEAFDGGMIHYHRPVNQIFSADDLQAGNADVIDRGLSTVVRALEERAKLLLRLAARTRLVGDNPTADRMEVHAVTLEDRAGLVRRTSTEVLKALS